MELSEKKVVKERLKVLFRTYRHMTPHIERELSDLGIVTARHKNHIVLKVNNKVVSLGCTVSDSRVGKKIVSSIMQCYEDNV